MGLTSESVSILIVLLPGFVSVTVLNAIIVRKDRDNFTKLFEALAFTVAAYGSAAFVVSLLQLIGGSQTSGTEATVFSLIGGGSMKIVLMPAFTLGYPLFIGASITHDWHMNFFRRIGVTNKVARDALWYKTTWSEVWTEQKRRYVVANLTDGTRILGWPMYYSDTPEEGWVYLYEPQWIDDNGDNIPMERHGILIKKEVIESLEFTRERS